MTPGGIPACSKSKIRCHLHYLGMLLICALYLALSSFAIGNYQNQNGDYAQYLIHSRNLLLGRPWGFLLETYAAVLPGYPLLLTPVLAIFGLNFAAIAWLHSILIACMGFLTYLLALRILKTRLLAFLTATIFLTNGFLINFQQDAQPNIFFAFSILCAFFAYQYRSEKPASLRSILLIVLLPLPGLIRLESFVLYIGLQFAKPMPGLVLRLYLALLTILPFLVSHFIKLSGKLSDYGVSAAGSKLPVGFSDLLVFIQGAFEFFLSMPLILTRIWYGAQPSVSAQIFLWLGTLGIFILLKTYRQFSFYFFLHLGLMFIFTLHSPALPERYLIPLLSIWSIAIFSGPQLLYRSLRISNFLFLSSALILFAALILPLFSIIKQSLAEPSHGDFYHRKDITESFDFVAKNFPDRTVGFYKPRIATLLLDERGIQRQAIGVRSAESASALFRRKGVVIILNAPIYGNAEMLGALSAKCNPVLNLESILIFTKGKHCRNRLPKT